MNSATFERVYQSFLVFHERFAPYFGRREAQLRSRQYLQGLFVQDAERKSAENLAEAVPGASARALQRFLTESTWREGPLLEDLAWYVGERLADAEGIFLVDETGFAKQGKESVGVARQYSGTLGKVGNCQVGVFLGYASPLGHALLQGRLFLPEVWSEDPARCREAGVPEEVGFSTKPEIALGLLHEAHATGALPARWVTADEVYGNSPTFRDGVAARGLWYVAEIETTLRLFRQPSEAAIPPWSGRGRPPTKRRLASGAAPAEEARAIRAALPASAWREITVAEGSQGPRIYRFARVRVWESRAGVPDREGWLLLRENLDGSELRSYLSNAPGMVSLRRLAQVAAARWSIETEFETLKGECGLDEYEVRSWRAWHHHITLSLLAGAFLLNLEQGWGGKAARPDAPAGRARATRDAATTALERGGVAGVAHRHTAAKPTGEGIPCKTPPQTAFTPAA